MIAVGHTSVGVLVAVTLISLSQPGQVGWLGFLVAIVAGIVLHYAADLIPHGHYYINTKNLQPGQLAVFFLDLFGGALLFLVIAGWQFGFFSVNFWLVLVAIAASQLTDVVEGLAAFKLIPRNQVVRKHSKFHLLVHWHNEPNSHIPGGGRPWRWSDVWQVCAFGLALVALIAV